MIERVRGRIVSADSTGVVVLVGGVGLQVAVSTATLASLPVDSEEVELLTYLVVREDALQLYGFGSEAERDLFMLLIGVQGVGPKLALAVLSSGDPGSVGAAIATREAARLQRVPGVGKRTAERIVVELRDKIAPSLTGSRSGSGRAVGAAAASADPRILARQALEGLGFSLDELDVMLAAADGEDVESIVASALKAARA